MADIEVVGENYEVELVIKRKRTTVKKGYGDEVKDRWTDIDDVMDLKILVDDKTSVGNIVVKHLEAGGF